MTIDETRQLPPVLSVPQAGAIVGLQRSAAYAAAERGEIPVLRFGRRLVVPKRGCSTCSALRGRAAMDRRQQRRGLGRHTESPALETITTTTTAEVNTDNVARDANVIPLADALRWRVQWVDGHAGPYWPSWRRCWSWTTAEASRRAG